MLVALLSLEFSIILDFFFFFLGSIRNFLLPTKPKFTKNTASQVSKAKLRHQARTDTNKEGLQTNPSQVETGNKIRAGKPRTVS